MLFLVRLLSVQRYEVLSGPFFILLTLGRRPKTFKLVQSSKLKLKITNNQHCLTFKVKLCDTRFTDGFTTADINRVTLLNQIFTLPTQVHEPPLWLRRETEQNRHLPTPQLEPADLLLFHRPRVRPDPQPADALRSNLKQKRNVEQNICSRRFGQEVILNIFSHAGAAPAEPPLLVLSCELQLSPRSCGDSSKRSWSWLSHGGQLPTEGTCCLLISP